MTVRHGDQRKRARRKVRRRAWRGRGSATEKKTDEGKVVTLDDLRGLAGPIAAKGKLTRAKKEVLKPLGVEGLANLDEAHYAYVYGQLTELLNEED